MEARGTAGANGSDIFCSFEVGAGIAGRCFDGSWDRAGDPGVAAGTGARAAEVEDEVEADPDRPIAGELATLPPGRGRRVAGDAICRWADRAGDAAALVEGVAAAPGLTRAGVAVSSSARAMGPVLVVAIVALRFASMSFDPWGMFSTTASSALDPPCICSNLTSTQIIPHGRKLTP